MRNDIFTDKTLLITGGTGSFGSTILKELINSSLKEIRIFSRDEKKQEDLRLVYNNSKLNFVIGDTRDIESVKSAVKGVDYIFHAAALKQVPSCEFYPTEAVKTNIIGSDNVMTAAIDEGVKKVVVLSTDKAVYPINAMGISKAMMEKIMLSKARQSSKTVLCATRYGNVMASRGSVIPLVVSQIKNNGTITITDPNMTRFLMSLDDSVSLVLHAFENANSGDIFVQKSPAATINDLVLALKEIFLASNSIRIIGTRHGEKLFESLVSREEMARAKEHSNYYQIPLDDRDLNYSNYFTKGEEKISHADDYTSHNAHRLNIQQIKILLNKLNFIKEELS